MRSWTLRCVLATLLAVPLLLVASAPAHACSCVSPRPQQLLKQADAVFAGIVEGTRAAEATSVTTIRVDQVWSGDVAEHTDVVHQDGLFDGACGITLVEGDRVVAFAFLQEGTRAELGVSLCSAVSDTSDLAIGVDETLRRLGPGVDPRAGTRASEVPVVDGRSATPYLVGFGLLAALGVAVAAWRLARRG